MPKAREIDGDSRDARWMARCLELAAMGGRTSPNPQVGCVIVGKGGKVLAEGWHHGPGTAHAEVDALSRLKKPGAAKGATMYVNLEPCNHQGRTPPCAPAVIASGVARVVIGALDPVPGHGGGAARIKRARIEVTSGVLAPACEELNRGFFTWARFGRPWFTLKAATTLDGRIATSKGESQWITGEVARTHVHALRAMHDAVLVGIGTVLADDPKLSVRYVAGADPVRVVLDSRLRTPPTAALFTEAPGVLVACGEGVPAIRHRRLERAGATVLVFPKDARGGIDLAALGVALAGKGITSCLVEGGAEVHGAFLAADLADELELHVAPKVLGGGRDGGPPWVGGDEVPGLDQAHRFGIRAAQFAGDDLLLTLRPTRTHS